jgi:hypothetical protein
MARPLGLPVGSVRALLLLALAARAILDLRDGRGLEPWLGAAILLSGAAYFAARASRRGMGPLPADAPRPRDPLGLPAGTVRTLFLLAAAYGAWLFVRAHGLEGERGEVAFVVGAFAAGTLLRWALARAPRPHDQATFAYEHVQALVALLCAGGLVAMAATGGPAAATSPWVEPALGAVCVFYAGAR